MQQQEERSRSSSSADTARAAAATAACSVIRRGRAPGPRGRHRRRRRFAVPPFCGIIIGLQVPLGLVLATPAWCRRRMARPGASDAARARARRGK